MRTKTLEAHDLRSVISPSGASRYAPAGFTTRENGVHYAATPRSGRISTRSDRVGYSELIEWTKEVINRLSQENVELSPFIRTFARPLDLASLSATLAPNVVAVDVSAIADAQYENPTSIRLLRKEKSGMIPLVRADADEVLAALERVFKVRPVRKELRLVDPKSNKVIGEIRVGKTRISLRRFDLAETADIFVERLDPPSSPEPLKRYVDQSDLFSVLFDQMDVIYLEGALYREPALVEGGKTLLSYLKEEPLLASTKSEKGAFSAAHTTFDTDSVFDVVIQKLAASDEVLACDDLGTEWADFIGVAAVAQTKTVTFYHAKHGQLSLGATPFHISVSQAIKNLRYLRATVDDVEGKREKWSRLYENENEETRIPRMVKGNFDLLREKFRETAVSPDTIRRVVIVTDSLSRRNVEETLEDAKKGKALPAYFVQLYGLLMGLFSACAEVGVYPTIICQP